MRNEEVLYIFKEGRNIYVYTYILHRINRRKAKWIFYNLHRNCLLEHVIERKVGGRMEVTGGRERRYKLLLDDLEEKRVYWKLH
jgi:hypothetical protein